MDWASLLYDPVYDVIGETAVILPGVGGAAVTVTALDKTAGVVVDDGNPRTVDTTIQTLTPAIAVRMADLTAAGLTRADLEGGAIEINGAIWHIKSSKPRPSPKGEAGGELLLLLYEA